MKLKRILALVLCFAMVFSTMSFSVFADGETPVAKVGNTEYATIDEAIAAWTNNTTLTLLQDVTLSDVIKLSSTEHHILDLSTYTMIAASGKNAIEIVAYGTGDAERSAITINADATNPGGINAGSKSVIYYNYANGGITTNDRPIIKINSGIFAGATSSYGTAGIYFKGGSAARQAATVNISGGIFNCSINGQSKSKLIISGGIFNYSVGSQGDSTANRLISGGTFKTLGFMTADSNNTKFWFGTSMGNSNVGVHVDDNGYIVVGGSPITEAGDTFEAFSTNYSGASSLLKYSSAVNNGLYYTSVEEAFADNNKATGSVTVYVDELDMTDISYKGTIVVPEGEEITIIVEEGATPAWTVSTSDNAVVTYTDAKGKVLEKGEDDKFVDPTPAPVCVATVNGVGYETIEKAIASAVDGDTITVIADYEFTAPVVIDSEYPVIIDLNGHTMTYNSTTQGEAMITNKGTLTINDSSNPDTGVINYNYTGAADSSYGKGNYTISNAGTLTVNGGKITIANLRGHAKYPIDNNSTTGDAILVINGGHLYNYNTSAIRQFCNSTTNKNSVTINGGLIEGYSAIWVQNPGKNTVSGKLEITGGEIRTTAAAYVNGTSEIKDVASKIYCTIDGEGGAWSEDSAVSITGGTINENVNFAANAPAAITIGEGATFNGYVETPTPDVAKIGDVSYKSIQAAVNAAEGDDVITVVADHELTWDGKTVIDGKYAAYVCVAGKAVTIDLNGKQLTGNTDKMNGTTLFAAFAADEGGSITLKDSVGTGSVSVTGDKAAYCLLMGYEGGTKLTVEGGTYYLENAKDSLVYSGGSSDIVTVNGGNFTLGNAGTGTNGSPWIFNAYDSNKNHVTVNGGTFNANIFNQYWRHEVQCAGKYAAKDNGNGTWTVVPAVACVAVPVSNYDYLVGYETVASAFAAAQDGEKVIINVAGDYSLSGISGKDITVIGDVDGVKFTNIGKFNMGGANVTFDNVTFDYTNENYMGLQHSGDLVYNNCTFNGQPFLYGTSETFNNCTFNQNSADAYNVWTYSAKNVSFNNCTFNSAGKSVLIYNEGACATDATFEGCTFTASQEVAGKAAIEIDTSSMPEGTDVVINNSTATGFAKGSVSGNSLWNDKKDQRDLSVTVDGATVWPLALIAKIGDTEYTSLAKALEAAQDGDEIVLLADVTENVTINKNITLEGADKQYTGTMTISSSKTVTINDVNFVKGIISEAKGAHGKLTITNCDFDGVDKSLGYAISVRGGDNVVIENTTAKNYSYGMLYIPSAVANISVKNVEVSDVTAAFNISYSGDGIFENVKVSNATYGLHVQNYGSRTFTLNGCEFDCDDPVYIQEKGTANVTFKFVGDNNFSTEEFTVSNYAKLELGEVDATLTAVEGLNMTTNIENYVVKYTNGAYVLAAVVAKIGDTGYTSLAEAIAAAQADETIELLADATIEKTTNLNKSITINGNGKKIAQSEGFVTNGANAVFDIMSGATVTFNGVTFDGIKDVAIMRTVSANVVIDDCVVSNCTQTVTQGLLRLACGNATITDSQFINNDCTMVVSFGFDAANETDVLTIDGCLFEGNTCGETAVVYFANGDYATVKNTKFVDNTVSATGNAATLYMGWGDGFEVLGCTFDGNTVTTSHTTTQRLAGAIFCDGCVVKENIFKDNTATKGDNTAAPTVAVAAYYGAADISENYWGSSDEPVKGINYTVEYTRNTVTNDSYYTAITEEGTIDKSSLKSLVRLAKIGDVEYETVAAAVEAAQAAGITDLTLTLIGETTKESAIALEDAFNLYTKKVFNSVTIKQEDPSKVYYIDGIYTGSRTNGGEFVFDGVNILVTGQYIFEGNVKLINNSYIESTTEANCFFYYTTTTIEPGSKIKGIIEDFRGGKVIVDGGKTDGTYNETPAIQDSIMHIRWSGDSLTLKNGAFVKVNAVNEVGRINLAAGTSLNVFASKLEAYQYIDNAGTINTDVNSLISTQKITGAGKISIDASDFDGTNIVAIKADMSGFTGTVEVTGNNSATYEITNEGIVITEVPVAKIGDTTYATLADALAAVTDGATVEILSDITIDELWDCRYNGAKITASDVTIDGKEHTLTINGEVNDKNWNTVFRFEGDNASVKNLTIDAANATSIQRGISSKGSITVENSTLIGNGTSAKRAIIFGEGAGNALNTVTATITNSKFINWSYGVSDNQSGKDAKAVSVTGSTFENASALISAAENVTFTGNKITDGYANITSYTAADTVKVNATGNTLVGTDDEISVNPENITADDVFITPVAKIGSKYYESLSKAFEKAADGNTITLVASFDLDEILVNTKNITLDLNGKTITGTDNTEKNFSLIDNRGDLTITGNGTMTLTATVNSGWNRYSAVLANNPGGKLTIENGTIEHLGGTDMAYGIDNLTNGKGTYAETVINGGTIKSTYRGIRQFLNGIEAQNLLTVNGGTIEGANKSIWMQDPSKNANSGKLTVTENATLNGDVYLTVTKDSTEWPVEVSIAKSAVKGQVLTNGNEPAGYEVTLNNGYYGVQVVSYVAQIGDDKYTSLQDAINASNGRTVTVLKDIDLGSTTVTIPAGVAMTLDLNGKTISGECNASQAHMIMVAYGADLTIDDSSAEQTGKITYAEGTSNVGWTIDVEGDLVLESGTIELTGEWSIGYAVDVRPNAWGVAYTEPTTFVMNNGKVVSSDGAVRVASSSSETYPKVAASFTMNGGEIDAAWDGVFVQQSDAAWDTLTFTINNGTIKSGLNPVRFYGPAATSYVNGEDCVDIELNGGTLTYTGTEERTWLVDNILRLGGGITEDDFLKDATVTASANFAQANVAEGYKWVESDGVYTLEKDEPATELFKFVEISASLDSSLALNIFLNSSDLTGEDYYAVIEHTKATGDVITTNIPYSKWETRKEKKLIRYTGIAAKEMADKIKITVYNADGTQASIAQNTSLRDYAIGMLNFCSQYDSYRRWLPVYVDMLNYGAAAQTVFNYNTSDLASKGAEDFQVHASPDYTLDKDGCYAEGNAAEVSLTLEEMIKLNVYFKNVTENMYAVYSYTTHGGTSIEQRVEYDSFISYSKYLGVPVEIAVADAATLVTVTMFNSDNTEAGKVVYSVNGYLKGMIDNGATDEIYPALAKFAASAKKAFAAD